MEHKTPETSSGGRESESESAEIDLEASKEEILTQALRSDEIPKIYANGFATSHGNSDVSLILQQYGKPVAVVQLSFTLAKTLVNKLGGAIENVEELTGKTIAVTDDFEDSNANKHQ